MPYGDEQSLHTMNRSAYGDFAAGMMGGRGGGGGTGYSENLVSNIGAQIRPVSYSPPARVHTGYYGQHVQSTGLFRGAATMMGLHPVPRGTTRMEYGMAAAEDFGERMASGASSMGLSGAGMLPALTPGAGLMGGMGLGMGGMWAAQKVQEGVQQRREINNFLQTSGYRFAGSGSGMETDPRRGAGLGAGARLEMTNFIRERDVADPTLSTTELTDIMKSATNKGMFTGTQDMDDFKKKFKEITDAVKTVTRTLHQTLEEGMQTIKDLRSIGIEPGQARDIVGKADAFGKMAGRTGTEMVNIGLQGAEMFRGTGVSMDIGMQGTMMNLAQVRASRDAGVLSQEAVAQAGGEESLAMKMNARGLAFSQSAMGRGVGAAFFSQGIGGAGFNQQAFMNNVMSGGGDFVDVAQSAARNIANPRALIAYEANQEKFMSEVGKTFGGQGLQIMQMSSAMSQAQMLSQATGADMGDAFNKILRDRGVSSSEREAMMGQITGAGKIFEASKSASQATMEKEMIEEASQNNLFYRFGGKIKDVTTSAIDVIARPIDKVITGAGEAAKGFYEEQVLGIQRTSAKGITAGRGAIREAGMTSVLEESVDLDKGGFLGGTTAGEALLDVLSEKGDGGTNLAELLDINIESKMSQQITGGDIVLKKTLSPFARTIQKKELDKISKIAAVQGISHSQAQQMKEAGQLEGVEGGTIMDVISSGDFKNVRDMGGLAKAAFGKDLAELGSSEIAKLTLETKGTYLESMVTDYTGKLRGVQVGAMNKRAAQLHTAVENYHSAKERFSNVEGIGQAPSDKTIGLISDAKRIASDKGSDSPEYQQAIKKVQESHAKEGASGRDIEAIGIVTKEAISGKNEAAAAALKDITAAGIDVAEIQEMRGGSALSRMLTSKISKSDLSAKEADNARVVAFRLGGVKDFKEFQAFVGKKSNADILKKLGPTGAALMKDADTLDEISKLDPSNVEDLEGKLDDLGLGGDVDVLKGAMEKGGGKLAAQKAFELIKSQTASASAVAAGTTGGAAQGAGGLNAVEQSAVQMNINKEILSAMQSMARSLKK